jgi:hypothetical protein
MTLKINNVPPSRAASFAAQAAAPASAFEPLIPTTIRLAMISSSMRRDGSIHLAENPGVWSYFNVMPATLKLHGYGGGKCYSQATPSESRSRAGR